MAQLYIFLLISLIWWMMQRKALINQEERILVKVQEEKKY